MKDHGGAARPDDRFATLPLAHQAPPRIEAGWAGSFVRLPVSTTSVPSTRRIEMSRVVKWPSGLNTMPTLLSSTRLIMMQVVGAGDRVSFARVGNTFVLTSGDWTREALLPARAGRFAP